MKKNFFLIKTLLSILFAFFVTDFLSQNLFLAHTPRINRNFFARFVFNTQQFIAKILSPKTSSQKTIAITEEILKNNLKPIVVGVKAASKDNFSYIEYDLDNVEWQIVELRLKDGRKIRVKYPKGMIIPPKEIFE